MDYLSSELMNKLSEPSESFQSYLLRLIDAKGLAYKRVYDRSLLSKQVFSSIKRNPHYHPDRITALQLCIGANLTLPEAEKLLSLAGYTFCPCDKRDIIFKHYIENGIYNMIEIDTIFEELDLPYVLK